MKIPARLYPRKNSSSIITHHGLQRVYKRVFNWVAQDNKVSYTHTPLYAAHYVPLYLSLCHTKMENMSLSKVGTLL